jgi:hypothetical protein
LSGFFYLSILKIKLYTFDFFYLLILSVLCVHLLLFIMHVEKEMDKTWITKSRGMREYKNGCRSFVDFAISNCRTLCGFIYCPCKSCRNNQLHPPHFVLDHLTRGKGIMTTCTTWYWHSENHVQGPVVGSYSNCLAADVVGGSTKQGGDMHTMLHDAFGMHKVREDNYEPEVVV